MKKELRRERLLDKTAEDQQEEQRKERKGDDCKNTSKGKGAANSSIATAETVESTDTGLKHAGRQVQGHRQRNVHALCTDGFNMMSDEFESDWSEGKRGCRSGGNRRADIRVVDDCKIQKFLVNQPMQ